MQTVIINGKQYELKASVKDVLDLLKEHSAKLDNLTKKPTESLHEVVIDFVIDALYRFLVKKKVFLFIKVKPFLTKRALAKALSIDELKACDKVIAKLIGLSEGE